MNLNENNLNFPPVPTDQSATYNINCLQSKLLNYLQFNKRKITKLDIKLK